MNISLELPEVMDLKPRISVIGVGGAGCNAVNNMISSGLEGVEFITANTDAQALTSSSAEYCIQLGAKLTEGLGAGADPDIGLRAAEEAIEEIRAQISGSHMLFIAAGMGGGTGTGAVPVIAKAAREMDILTVAIVSKPFHFEGTRRMRTAQSGIEKLRDCVDTLIVVPNQNLFHLANEKTTFAEAFIMADQVLHSGVACIVDLIVKDGHINLDFADVKAVMKDMGSAMMGTGEASGEKRATKAAKAAISNPLLTDISLRGAKGLLISIIGGSNVTLFEVDEAANCVKQEADPEANIIIGATFEESMQDRIRVSIVASGLPESKVQSSQTPPSSRAMPGSSEQPLPGSGAPRHASVHPASSQEGITSHVAWENGARRSVPRHEEPPQLPQSHAALAAHGDPYLGQTKADEFARALSEVVGTVPEEEHAEGLQQASSNHHAPPESLWQSPDGIVIEDGFEPPFVPSVQPEEAVPPTPDAQPAAAGFVPSAPAKLPRRLPDVSEFSDFAQHAYQAKASRNQGDSNTKEEMPNILKRLARLGRQTPQGGDKSGENSLNSDEPTTGSQDAQQAPFSASGHRTSGNF